MREYYEITLSDVGKPIIRAFGRTWLVSHFIGHIMVKDVGKRVFCVDGILQIENDDQLKKRLNSAKALSERLGFSPIKQETQDQLLADNADDVTED